MKKAIIAVIAAAVLCASLTGCGDSANSPVTGTVSSTDKADISQSSAAAASSASSTQSAASSTAQSSKSTVTSSAASSTQSTASSTQSTASSTAQSSVSTEASSTASAASSTENSAAASSAGDRDPVVIPTADYDADFFKDDLFIGDSIFTGLYLYSYLEHKNVAAAVGYTAYGAQVKPFDENFYRGSAVDYAKSMQPKHIIIMLGLNGLSPLTNFADFENGYRGLLNTLKKDCPDSVICAVSVTPITANSSGAVYSGVTNAIIDNANVLIKSLSDELGVLYYDLNSVLKDENGYFDYKYAEVDGMHFRGSTYPVFLSGVEKVLKQQ